MSATAVTATNPDSSSSSSSSSTTQSPRGHLGHKGYTLDKRGVSAEVLASVRKDLTIRPFVLGAPTGGGDDKLFYAYRENSRNLYVPHYYGVSRFGPPTHYAVQEGADMHPDVVFVGTPRDYQAPVIDKFLRHCTSAPCGGGLLELYTAWGKTSGALCIGARLKKKMLVIVHKEFLMNQWIERIGQFLPAARVGKIQGPVVDVEDKDIVLCMLQSLVSKDYPAALFAQFGFTVIDEVHHISSTSFSASLFKVLTKYMLGISATMTRKDGTTDVFKMFLGEVLHKAERTPDLQVEVRAVTFRSSDAAFNATLLDYRGNPQISSMISKVCEFSPRTDFIVRMLCDAIAAEPSSPRNAAIGANEDSFAACGLCGGTSRALVRNTCCDCVSFCLPCLDARVEEHGTRTRSRCPACAKILKYEQNYVPRAGTKPLEEVHIIVMAHNLNVLRYIYNRMVCRNLASVGFYVGGMSEEELKKSEKKQIVLATYGMSSEGLDIPTLNMEFLVSPKTDIVQTVGRILRAKHAHSHPIIYDVVDAHDVFQRQWSKRRAFYKKNNYRIVSATSDSYSSDFGTWKVVAAGVAPGGRQQKRGWALTATATATATATDSDDNDAGDNSDGGVTACLLPLRKRSK